MRFRTVAILFGVAALLYQPAAAWAGKTAAGPNGNGRTIQILTCSPDSVGMPMEHSRPMTVCLSGFPEGDMVTVYVPWIGTPDAYTDLIYSRFIDPTGGFCFDAPPDWATINLAPGTYSVRTSWYRNGHGGGSKGGPSAEFVVVSD